MYIVVCIFSLCTYNLHSNTSQGKISCKFLHVLCTERALKMSPFLQETCKTCKNCARNFTSLAQFLASSKNLVRNLQGARILHGKCPFSCSVSRILQDIFPWDTMHFTLGHTCSSYGGRVRTEL